MHVIQPLRRFRFRTPYLALVICLLGLGLVDARTRRGDKLYSEGLAHQSKKEWDAALEFFENALADDPGEMVYQMAVDKTRFQAGQFHIERGLAIRAKGQLGEGLIEFQRAHAINPASVVAAQEIQETKAMILRERKHLEQTGKEEAPEVRAMTAADLVKKEELDKMDRILPVPELKPLRGDLVDFRMNGAKTKVVFETIGKYAGINVIWDLDYNPPAHDAINVDFENSTIEQALDYVSVITKSFWKALSPNTIFIANDNVNKRRDYAEQVCRVFYRQNINLPAELQELVNMVRTMPDLTRVMQFTGQNAIVVRGETDQVELAGKLIHDLDQPKPEVLVDILVFEASSTFSKQITAALASTGFNIPVNFNPRGGIQAQSLSGSSSSGSNSSTPAVPISNMGRLASSDFSTSLPGALLEAALSDANTTILQAPELRAADNVKASLKVGQRIPMATGSFSSALSSAASPLVNTQFSYYDVGVNVDMVARIHSNNDVSVHLELDISTVAGSSTIAGVAEPVIGQRKVTQEFTMAEGEVGLIGGLTSDQNDKTLTGIPGLSSIPLLGHLFKGDSMDRTRDDIMIAIVPHVVRRPSLSATSLHTIGVGTQTAIKLGHSPKGQDGSSGNPVKPAPAPAGPVGNPPATAPPEAPATIKKPVA
jgi:general secretion pathway protein D